MANKSKKALAYLFEGVVIITILSLVLTVSFSLLKWTNIAGVFFIIFLGSAAIIIGITLISATIILCRDIRADGLAETVKPLLQKLCIWSIILLILTYISQHKLLIWEVLAGSAALSLISMIDYRKFIPRDIEEQDRDIDAISGTDVSGLSDIDDNYNHLENLILAKLAGVLEIAKITKLPNSYYIIDSKNHLGFGCSDNEVIIFFYEEHYHIMTMDYDNMNALATEVSRFLELFINRTVRFEYYYHDKEQIRLKLYSLHNNEEELIEDIRMTLNPLLLKSTKKAEKEIKLITFKQQ